MTIVAIGGEPATGKTSLIYALANQMGTFNRFEYGLVRGMQFRKQKVLIVGIYDGATFAGTDKLSMAVQRDFNTLMNDKQFEEWSIVFEGDRLFNERTFVNAPLESRLLRVVLVADETLLNKRHIVREDDQNSSWLKGRKTKIENLKAKYHCEIWVSNTTQELNYNLSTLMKFINVKPE